LELKCDRKENFLKGSVNKNARVGVLEGKADDCDFKLTAELLGQNKIKAELEYNLHNKKRSWEGEAEFEQSAFSSMIFGSVSSGK
jgi:hypothetical protein